MQVTVELRPHKGVQNTPFGPVEIEHDQYMVFGSFGDAKPMHMGYLSKSKGSTFCGLPSFSELPIEAKKAVVAEISSQREEDVQASECVLAPWPDE